ncbi:MAG: hypothetical protein K0R75_1148 [Paenibacillaceae bacterium]|jgi:hypothetical protein|nr:hypothetical protein [Paenibacillaceae bacterium]
MGTVRFAMEAWLVFAFFIFEYLLKSGDPTFMLLMIF